MAEVADIVVVGNGVIGTAIAWEAARRHPELSVTLVGPAARPGGASAAAGAMLGLFGEVTKYTWATEAGRAKFALGLRARELWPALLDRLADVPGEHRAVHVVPDTYLLLNGRSGSLDSENFAALRAVLDAEGEPYEEVETVPGLDPVPDARPLRAIHLPEEGAVDGGSVLARLTAAAEVDGVACVDATVASLSAQAGRVDGVALADGRTIRAGHVVLAAGAFSTPLLEPVLEPHEVQPVLAGSGVAFVAARTVGDPFPSVVRSVTRAGSCGLHVIPLPGGREYFGATNVIFAEPETRFHLGVWHFVADCAMDQLDQKTCYSRVEETRVGNRPVPLDTFPLLGGTSLEGLTVVTGTYRDGFHLAPLLATLAVDELERPGSAFPKIFRADRPPILGVSREESIDEFVHHAVSTAFETNTRLSRFMHSGDLDSVYRPGAEALYEALGATEGLPPDLLTYLLLSRKSPADAAPISRYLVAHGLAAAVVGAEEGHA